MLKLLVGVACAAGAFGLCAQNAPDQPRQVNCHEAVTAWAKPGYVDDAVKTRVAWCQVNGQLTDSDLAAAIAATKS